MPSHASSKIWAVTSYYNPGRFQSRWKNYRVFREHMPLPLLTICLDFGAPELADDDADILVRLTQGDVLWQKERLFNEACRYLPETCEKVVWADCDVVFPDPGWASKVSRELDRVPVVQPFSWVHRCRPEELSALLHGPPLDPADRVEGGCAYMAAHGWPTGQTRAYASTPGQQMSSPGIAWATHRDFIAEVGFFDAMIIGAGDAAFYSGVSGDMGPIMSRRRPPAVLECWQEWRDRALARSQGRVGYVEGWVLDLWHGEHVHRKYDTRWDILRQHDFDPRTDLRMGEQGAWLWGSDKPELHAALRDYFHGRLEDGGRLDREGASEELGQASRESPREGSSRS